MNSSDRGGFVSRGGVKLEHAIREWALDVRGKVCADLGASTGGFTDALLRAGASKVYAVDTAYGELAWVLRNDPRVVVMERTNALHASPPEAAGVVVVDLGWTPQRLAVPAAVRWLGPGGRIVTLIKPHYEARGLGVRLPRGGVLSEEQAGVIRDKVLAEMGSLGVEVLGVVRSPIQGGAGKSRGNAEWLALLGAAAGTGGVE